MTTIWSHPAGSYAPSVIELYDQEKDPGERVNRIADPALGTVRKALTAELDGFYKEQGARPLEEWRRTTTQNLTKYSSTGPAKE